MWYYIVVAVVCFCGGWYACMKFAGRVLSITVKDKE
jgi:hypothetical protein